MFNSFPIVTIQIQDPTAAWYQKWILNLPSDQIKAMGGPWNTQKEAVDRMAKCPGWKLRQGTKEPHFDKI